MTLILTVTAEHTNVVLANPDADETPSISLKLSNDHKLEELVASDSDAAVFIERELDAALSNILLYVATVGSGGSNFRSILEVISDTVQTSRKIQLSEVIESSGVRDLPRS